MKLTFCLVLLSIVQSFGVSAQSCPAKYTYHSVDKTCSGPPISANSCLPGFIHTTTGGISVCTGPTYNCPGQPGFGRVFKEGSQIETVCTNAPSVDIDVSGNCPDGFYHSAIAHPPYNDLCISRKSPSSSATPSEKRSAFAQLQEKDEKQLEPEKQIKITTSGVDGTTWRVQEGLMDAREVSGYVSGGQGYAQQLWRLGFRLSVFTDGKSYWGAPLSPTGYKGAAGPFGNEPDLPTSLASLKRADQEAVATERNEFGQSIMNAILTITLIDDKFRKTEIIGYQMESQKRRSELLDLLKKNRKILTPSVWQKANDEYQRVLPGLTVWQAAHAQEILWSLRGVYVDTRK